jgi:hypothetical protein
MLMYVRRILLILLAAGCGGSDDDDDGEPPVPFGVCGGIDDDGSDDPGPAGLYDDPGDFDRAGCGDGEPLASVDGCGIWHLDLDFADFGNAVGAIRIDPSGQGDLEGLIFGRETEDVRFTSTDLFMRHVEVDDEGNEVAIRAFNACERRDDGSLAGTYVGCNADGECGTATAIAYKVEPFDEVPAEGVTLLAEFGGGAAWTDVDITFNVRHRDELAYLARGRDGLRIVDLADPAAPGELGHLPAAFPEVGEYYNDVKIADGPDGDRYALMGSNIRGVVVIDVTDPSAPAEVLTFPTAPPEAEDPTVNVHSLFVEGQRLYITYAGGIEIYDIADPSAPVRVGAYWLPDLEELGGFVHDLFVEDGIAYLNYWNRGMVVIDAATDPADPILLGVFDGYERRTSHSNWVTTAGGRQISVHGDEDFGAHVRIVDADPDSATAFQEIGSYQTRPEVSVHNIMTIGETALVTHYQDGLRVLDLSDPTTPVEVGHFQTWPGAEPGYGIRFYESAIGVDHDPERDLVLLADTHRGLFVLSLDR